MDEERRPGGAVSGGAGGGGDDAPERWKDAAAETPHEVDVLDDRTKLPVLVALFALAVGNETISSLFYCRC